MNVTLVDWRQCVATACSGAILLICGGCVDDPGTAPSHTEREIQLNGDALESTATVNGGPDLVIKPRFTIDVHVNGALKPGRPIHLTVTGSAHVATADAEVRLILPEIAAAGQSGWGSIDIPVGREIAPALRLRKRFAAGESFRERITVTIPEPGYYQVLASVSQRSEDSRTDVDGNVLGTGAGRDLWLWVDEHGGRVTDRFEPAAFPAGARRIRGPRGSERERPRVRHGDVTITCSVTPAGTFTVAAFGCPPAPDTSLWVGNPPQPNATASATVTYSDVGAGVVRPLADARIAWKVVNTITGAQVAAGSGYTSAAGTSAVIDCLGPTSERRLDLTVHTDNRKAEVKSYITSNSDRTMVGQHHGSCGGVVPVTADNQQAHLFMNLTRNWDGHLRAFGSSPPVMRAGLHPQSGYGSRYDYGSAEIRIEPRFDHVWGEHGVMVAAHEWAHLWQDQHLYQHPAANGLKRYYNLACPNPHPPGEYTNQGCAFGEAFADWYAVVVREADLPGWRRDLEENRLHLYYCGNKCSDNGSIVQGAVHAFLWDIVDGGTSEPFDRVQKPASSVVDAIKSCEVTINRVEWSAYTGIDHLIWCFERRFPYQVRLQKTFGAGDTLQTFFNTRPSNLWANDARGFPVANLSDDLRRLWLVNLFSRRTNVGTSPILRSALPDGDPGSTDPPCGDGPGQFQCPT